MARRPAALDAALALVLGLEMQVEMFLVDAPRGDSLGARAEARQFHVGLVVLVVATPIVIRLDQPPGGVGDFFFVATIVVGGPILLGRLVRARVRLNQALA